MIGRERGFLLLTSHLGDPVRKPLSVAQFRTLAQRVQAAEMPAKDRELTRDDLIRLGYGYEMAERIHNLLDEEARLDHYLTRGARAGCVPIVRGSEDYPLILRKRLGLESPGVLWAKGDVSLLTQPTISLVGSREIAEKNRAFAREVGRQAAKQGYVLVSGNARGADRIAQDSCLEAGGQVISVVADELWKQNPGAGVLYLSEDSFDEEFSSQRALSRNRVIHGLGLKTFVAQSNFQSGGTWDGTVKNLRFSYSPVFCCDDGSEAMTQLAQMGAQLIGMDDLDSIYDLKNSEENIFDR